MNIAETLTKNNQTHILDALNRLSGAEHDKLLNRSKQSTGITSPLSFRTM